MNRLFLLILFFCGFLFSACLNNCPEGGCPDQNDMIILQKKKCEQAGMSYEVVQLKESVGDYGYRIVYKVVCINPKAAQQSPN